MARGRGGGFSGGFHGGIRGRGYRRTSSSISSFQ